MSKTSNNNKDDAAATAAVQTGEAIQPDKDTTPSPTMVRIKTTAKATIGRMVYAPGVPVTVTPAQASALEAMHNAKIIGV